MRGPAPARLAAALLAASMTPGLASGGPFGASLREQLEHVSDDSLGAGSAADTVAQHRLLVNLDLQPLPGLRAFGELGVYAQNGRNGGSSPVDESAPDLHQGYLDWRSGRRALRLRAGRSEWTLGSGRLVSVRDGPNIRRAFDGVQLDATLGSGSLRLLWGRPVHNRDGAFDDRPDRDERLSGAQVALGSGRDRGIELYGLDYARDGAAFAAGVGDEQRRSWGLRLHGREGSLDYNTELVGQTGHWRGTRIRAWTVANDFGWRFAGAPFAPRLGLKADVASGDSDPGDARLQTFNALYPNPSYFSDAALIAPANLIDLQPNVGLAISPRLSLYLGWNLLWKHRAQDAVFTTPVPLTAVDGSAGGGERFIGHQVQLSGQWTASKHLSIEASAVRFDPGSALAGPQGQAIDYLQLVLRFSD